MDEAPRTNRTGLAAGILGAVAVVVVALAIVLDLGPFTDGELSAAEFLAQGDEICKETHAEFLDVQRSTPRTADDAAAQVEALIDLAEEERDAILELDAPASLNGDLDAYIEERERGIETLQDGLAAARDDDPAAYEEAQAKLASQQAGRHAIARKLGFSECSEPLVGEDELERQAQPPAS